MVMVEGVGDECRSSRGLQKAIVALARRWAVIMHRIWSDGTEFRWTREKAFANGLADQLLLCIDKPEKR